MSATATAEERAADFVRRFEKFWAAPSTELLGTLLADEVRLVAPMTPVTHTLADGKRAFAGIFDLVPDLTGEVDCWGATEAGVLINLTLGGTAGGKQLSWTAVDRIAIGEDGLATERISYFDSMPLILAVARRPRIWPGFLRSRLGGRQR